MIGQDMNLDDLAACGDNSPGNYTLNLGYYFFYFLVRRVDVAGDKQPSYLIKMVLLEYFIMILQILKKSLLPQ